MIVSCHVMFDTVAEVKDAQGMPVAPKGRSGLDECTRLSTVYDALYAIILKHFEKKDGW